MTIQTLTIGDPFFAIRILKDESRHPISGKAIVLNLADTALKVREQSIGALQSVILTETEIREVAQAVLIEGYDDHSDEADLLARIRQTWPLAFQVRGEERLRGVEH